MPFGFYARLYERTPAINFQGVVFLVQRGKIPREITTAMPAHQARFLNIAYVTELIARDHISYEEALTKEAPTLEEMAQSKGISTLPFRSIDDIERSIEAASEHKIDDPDATSS